MPVKLCKKGIYIFSLLILFSCKQKEDYQIVRPKLSDQKIALDTSYLEIQIDSNGLFEYPTSSYTQNGIYCGYNFKSNSLDFFDLIHKKQLFKSKLKTDSKIGYIAGCALINTDSVFLLTDNSLLLANKKGEITKSTKINFDSQDPFFKKNYLIEFQRSRSFLYDPSKRKVIATNVNPKGMRETEDFNASPAVEIGINEKLNFEGIPISWSKLYQRGNYGYLIKPYLTSIQENLIVSFPIDPNIYVYNENSKKLKVYGGSPDFKSSNPIPLPLDPKFIDDADKKMMHLFENINYGKIISEADGRLHYRVIKSALTGEDKIKHDFSKRKNSLVVYNSKFEIVKVLDLNDYKYVVDAAFAIKDNLYIPCIRGANNLRFKVFKFKI
ncbi:DUF4221 family protein [Pedobacter sp. Du54]|uniref:DUF4221 family protein n=1 Tax=Pedobacter anseongensis TaxID=3133439 RepID=UPI0030B03980